MTIAKRLRVLALTAVLAVGVVPGAATAESATSEAGIGAASALSSLVYGPAKLLYATTGLLIGGFAWGLSGGDNDVLTAVIVPAVRGDYVITPSHLRGDETVEFFGEDPQYRASYTAQNDPLAAEQYSAPSTGDYSVGDYPVITSEDY